MSAKNILCFFLMMFLTSSCFATSYKIESIGQDLTPISINDNGQIVGNTDDYAFFWEDGVLTSIGGIAGGTTSLASDLNNSGVMVGTANSATSGHVAYYWQPGMTSVGILANYGYETSRAFAINDAGQIAGWAFGASDGIRHATRWDSYSSDPLDLGSLGSFPSRSWGISPQGYVVGDSKLATGERVAFLWDENADPQMQNLGILGTGDYATAGGMSESGLIIGASEYDSSSEDRHAFVWDAINGMQDIHDDTFGATSSATDINDSDIVVGNAELGAFIWDATSGMQSVLDLLASDSGWSELYVTSINNQGQIVGSGMFNGEYYGFIITPIPEPHTVMLLISAIAMLSKQLRR